AHGTSMGGMIALAFTAKYPEKTIAACADCAMARCDTYRRIMFRNWRQQCEALPLDDFCDLLTIQAVGADLLEANPGVFDAVKRICSRYRTKRSTWWAPSSRRSWARKRRRSRAPAPDPRR